MRLVRLVEANVAALFARGLTEVEEEEEEED